MSVTALVKKLKTIREHIPEAHAIRLHRALSWLKAAMEQEKNSDLCFICLWISANSLYAIDETDAESKKERDRFADFADRLILLDHESRIFHLLWEKFTGPVRILLSNHYVYEPFWDYQRNGKRKWEKGFQQSIIDANNALSEKNVKYLLRIVLDRLYVLRNQLIHGGATFKSQMNRNQVRDGSNILRTLLPVFIDIMIENPESPWGQIYYPPV